MNTNKSVKMSSFYKPPDINISTLTKTKPGGEQKSFVKTIKFQLGCLSIAFGFILTLSLIVLPLEALCFLLVRPWSLWTHRKISSFLHLIMCSYFIVLTEWWSNTKIQICVDPQDLQLMKKEHSILLVNHRCPSELLVIASLVNHLGIFGNLRSFMKKSLSYLPILGWVWALQENIFLERNFEKDRLNLEQRITSVFKHTDPFSFIFFPEGTRFTKEKHMASMKIAGEKGLPELKHLLLPRTKGFVTFLEGLKKIEENTNSLPVSIIDVLVSIHFEGSESFTWTFSDALKGQGADVKIVLRRYSTKDIPFENNDVNGECAMWLHRRYQEKDKLLQNYKNSPVRNFFSDATETLPSFKLPKSWIMLFLVIFLDMVLFVPITSQIIRILKCGSIIQVNMVLSGVFVVNFVYKRLIDGTKG